MYHFQRRTAMKKKAKKQRIREIRQIQELKHEKKKWLEAGASGYNPEYCRMLIEHCEEGFSFQAFAAKINVLPEVLNEWTGRYPEFRNAKSIAESRQRIFWETKAIEACREKFLISIFRYFTSDSREGKADVPEAVVILPEEEKDR